MTRTTWGKLKKGQKFKVFANTNSHSYPLNTVLTMDRDGTDTQAMDRIAVEITGGNNLNIRDVQIIERLASKEEIQELQQTLKDAEINYIKEKARIEAKIDFCKKFELDEFDPDIVEVWGILENNKKMSNIELAKLIAESLLG